MFYHQHAHLIPSRCVHFHVSTSFFPSGTLAPLQNLKAFYFINILWWHLGWTKQHGLNLLSGSDLPDCLCPLVSTPLLHPGRLTASTVNMFPIKIRAATVTKTTHCYWVFRVALYLFIYLLIYYIYIYIWKQKECKNGPIGVGDHYSNARVKLREREIV